MRVDLHSHTLENSDGKAPAREMIQAGIERGLDGLVLTDHHYMLTRDEQSRLEESFPDFRIFRGAEASIGADDILVIGGDAEKMPWDRRMPPEKAGELKRFVEDAGAFAIWAHPFWRADEVHFDLDAFCPEGIEVASMNINTAQYERIFQIAEARAMLPTAGSDAHKPREVGLFHIKLDERADDEEALIRLVRQGRYETATFESMWQARYDEIAPQEALARKVLAEGGTEQEYLDQGGRPVFFKRPIRGASYLPKREAIGIRPRWTR